jgi:hypothetical protein
MNRAPSRTEKSRPGHVTYEIQLVPRDGEYWFALTMTHLGSQWTSQLAKLEATEEQAAFEEAAEQVGRMHAAMHGKTYQQQGKATDEQEPAR